MIQAQLLGWLISAIAVAAIATGGYFALQSHFQAPIKAELVQEKAHVKDLVDAVVIEQAARKDLSDKLLARDESDKKIRIKLEGLSNAITRLKIEKPEVKVWADTRIPDDVISLLLSKTLSGLPPDGDRPGATPDGSGTSPPSAGSDEPRPIEQG